MRQSFHHTRFDLQYMLDCTSKQENNQHALSLHRVSLEVGIWLSFPVREQSACPLTIQGVG